MKTYLLSSIFLMLSLFGTVSTQAQQMNNDKNNYVVLTKKIPQLQPIILTAEALKADEGDVFGDFQVILCGQQIGDITDAEKTKMMYINESATDTLSVTVLQTDYKFQ